MFQDFAARGLAVQNRRSARRLATIDTLARGIAENFSRGLPEAIDVPIAESAHASTQISGGTVYPISGTTPSIDRRGHFSFYGADWQIFGSNFNLAPLNVHTGNGSDPTQGIAGNPSGTVRFATYADKFELNCINSVGFRVKVNGKYCQTGMYGIPAINGYGSNASLYWLFDFAGTEFEGNGLKLVEVQYGAAGRFRGLAVPVTHTVQPWPQAVPLKAALHGDSMVTTGSDTSVANAFEVALHGRMPHIVQTLTGVPDIWANNIGGVGFAYDGGGIKSNFVEQASVDFSGARFDLVWELGGRNDSTAYGTEASYRDVVQSWIEAVLADNSDTIVVMTGPLSVIDDESYQSSPAFAAMQRAKKAACAKYPQNCAFIETCGNATTNTPWIFGTGKQGGAAGDGNADLIRGADDTHPTVFGHRYFAARLVAETARVLPGLASRIRDGVIGGINDTDLV